MVGLAQLRFVVEHEPVMQVTNTVANVAHLIGLLAPVATLFVLNLLGIEASDELMWALMGLGGMTAISGGTQWVAKRRILQSVESLPLGDGKNHDKRDAQ